MCCMRGDSITLQHAGKALVLAVNPSRVIVEIPTASLPPRALEVAPAEGSPDDASRSRRRIGAGAEAERPS